jgi:hypothetical protein
VGEGGGEGDDVEGARLVASWASATSISIVCSLRTWVEGYPFPLMEVSMFLVVRGMQPARPPDGTNLCLQPAPVDLRARN